MRFAVGRSDAGDDLFILQMKKSAVAPTMLVLQAMTNALQCHPGSTVTLRSDFAFMGQDLFNFLWFSNVEQVYHKSTPRVSFPHLRVAR